MKSMTLKTRKTVIIGAGRAGGSLAAAMQTAGYSLAMIIDTDASAAGTLAGACGCRYADHLESVDSDAGLVFLAVPDDSIGVTARAAAAADLFRTDTIVAHLSGRHPASVLAPLTCPRASFHPCSTFLPGQQGGFTGITVAIEGDPAAVEPLTRLAGDLGARPVLIEAGQKALYHAACTMASNLLAVVVHQAERLLAACGGTIDPAALMPLVRRTVENIGERGSLASLTGPVMRGDRETVRAHVDAIRTAHPELLELYRTLSLAAADMAVENGADRDRIAGVIDVLHS
ncbi:DUF2520 domain-containing protein [bacterium]|nr:DUF2520 domain-containing protein [bacterium]